MSIEYINIVWKHSKATNSALLVMLALADYSDHAGYSFPSLDTISRKARITERNCRYVLRELEKGGELQCLPNEGRNGTNLYRITLTDGGEAIFAGGKMKQGGGQNATVKPLEGGQNATETVRTFAPKPSVEPPCTKEPSKEPSTLFDLGVHYKEFIPDRLRTKEFLELWDEWKQHRKEKGQKLTPSTIKKQLKMLNEIGPVPAIAIIENAIEKGWQGLYPVKANSAGGVVTQPDYNKEGF